MNAEIDLDHLIAQQGREIETALAAVDPYGAMIQRIERAKTGDELRLIEDQMKFNKAFDEDERKAILNSINARFGELNAKAVGRVEPRWRNQQ